MVSLGEQIQPLQWVWLFVSGPLTAEGWVQSQASPCETVLDKVALGQVSLLIPRFPLVSIIPPALNTNFFIHHRRYNNSTIESIVKQNIKITHHFFYVSKNASPVNLSDGCCILNRCVNVQNF